MLSKIFDIFLHLDKNLAIVINDFGAWTYVFLFLIIFMETGLVVTPFLPGDSLLFAAGALAALGSLNIFGLFFLFIAAAIIGDSVNYSIGKYLGPKAYQINNRFIKKRHIEKTQQFFEKHGGKAIILARFIPIIRTFAPFVAGVGSMNYYRFILFNVIGGLLWVCLFLFSGFFFGNLPFVKNNFHYVVILIILISLLPIVYEVIKSKLNRKQ
ncbi:MAG: DedA family protein [bacterium]